MEEAEVAKASRSSRLIIRSNEQSELDKAQAPEVHAPSTPHAP